MRARILAGAVADARQIKSFDTSTIVEELSMIARQAVERAVNDPAVLALGPDGISPLEAEVVPMAFEAIVGSMWPSMVKAYLRGADSPDATLPDIETILDRPASELAAILDELNMTGLREQIHARAWAFATKVATSARRVVAMATAGPAA